MIFLRGQRMMFLRGQRMIFTSIAVATTVVAAAAAAATFISDSNGLADAERVSLHNLRRSAAIVQ